MRRICEWAGATAGAKATAKVRIFHLPRRRTAVTLSAPVDGDFVGCCFSADGKFLVAHTCGADGEPSSTAAVWQWAEERLLGLLKVKAPLARVRFKPGDASLLSYNPPMRLVRLNDAGHMSEVDVLAFKGLAVADHLWLGANRLVLATADGEYHVFDDLRASQTVRGGDAAPSCLCAFAGGFLAGCDDGRVLVFRRQPVKVPDSGTAKKKKAPSSRAAARAARGVRPRVHAGRRRGRGRRRPWAFARAARERRARRV